jgi:hypothetical protein
MIPSAKEAVAVKTASAIAPKSVFEGVILFLLCP